MFVGQAQISPDLRVFEGFELKIRSPGPVHSPKLALDAPPLRSSIGVG
jgi:hypothetical protein